MVQSATSRNTYQVAFEHFQREISAPPRITALRERGFEYFSTVGFPTTKMEQWRFTNIAAIANTDFDLAEPADISSAVLDPYELHEVQGIKAVSINGRFSPTLSRTKRLPVGIEVSSLANALTNNEIGITSHLGCHAHFEDHAFTALNTAFLYDGVVVWIHDNAIVDLPIHLLFVTTAADRHMNHPRVLVVAGENSQVRLVESYVGLDEERYFTNAVTEIIVGKNAVIDHYKLVRDSIEAFHIGNMHVRLEQNANFSSHSITLGGALVRNEVEAKLAGEGGECTLNGLYLANGDRLVDNRTTIRHEQPHCSSHELYKGILDDQAHAVFNGKIVVAIDAQKTNATQTNKAILLSEDARINTKPELEIFADDVKCTHGATIGQLDENALFYLRSRGLAVDQARRLLIHAFASDLLNRISIEPIRAQLDALLLEHLPSSDWEEFNG